MSRAKVEQHPATGMTLVVMVGLSILFLLFMAFLNVVKTGNILNEANFLYASSLRLWPPGPASSLTRQRWRTAGTRPAILHSPAFTKCC